MIALSGGKLTAPRLKTLEGLLASKRQLVRPGVNQSNAGESSAPRAGARPGGAGGAGGQRGVLLAAQRLRLRLLRLRLPRLLLLWQLLMLLAPVLTPMLFYRLLPARQEGR